MKKTIIENEQITIIYRWGKNGKFYQWENPSQKQAENLIKKYGLDQIIGGALWLQW